MKYPLIFLSLVFASCSPPDEPVGDKPEPDHAKASDAGPSGHQWNGPEFVPPFEIKKGERVDAELKVTSFLDSANNNQPAESATIVAGNKRIAIREAAGKTMGTTRENESTIFVNDEPVLRLILVSDYQNKGGGTVSMTDGKIREKVEFVADPETNSMRWSYKYPLPDGEQTTFSYAIKSLGQSKVEFSWDVGLTAEQIEKFTSQGDKFGNVLLYLVVDGDYRSAGLDVNGVPIEPGPIEELKAKDKQIQVIWQGRLNDMTYSGSKPLYGVSVHSETGLDGSLRERALYGRIDLDFQLTGNRPQDRIVIDFGEVRPPDKDSPPPIEGHDLWDQDALHIPQSPTRNLFPNPSFEQGMRYWRWWTGGATYTRSDVLRYQVDPDNGLFGGSAMVIHPVQEGSVPLRSFSLPGEKGKTYTLSFYAKAENPEATLGLAPYSSKTGGQFDRNTVINYELVPLDTQWKRYSQSFVSDGAPVSFVVLARGHGGKIWLDGMQLEAGDEATDFTAPPLAGELVTLHHQNNLEFGSPVGAKFKVKGESGTKGKITFTLEDFYGATIWSSSEEVESGKVLDLPFDDLKLATGAYFLKTHFEVPGSPAYDDYYRFTVIDSLDGTHPTKDLYGALMFNRNNRVDEHLELIQRLGFGGSTSYGEGAAGDPLLYELREKYKITDYTHEMVSGPHLTREQKAARHPDLLFGMSIDSRIWRTPEERESIKMLDSYSDEVLERMEALAEKVARECPYVRVWSISTEEEGTIPTLSERMDFEEYAKLQIAFYRGIKKGNPDAIVMPSGGTSGYGKVRGKKDIEGYLAATKGKVKWDAIAIHPYGSVDGTLGNEDLDEAIQMLKDSIAQYGYGDETPLLLNEGGGANPSRWGDGPDYSYDGGQPSYHQGLHEFLHAAKLARQYLITLKYWPQIPHYNTWQDDERVIMDYNLTPSTFMLGINTLGRLLGNPKFVADIRPAQGVRGYAFDDAKNKGVAAIWCTVDDVERGFLRGPVMRVRFDGKLPELIDLMGRSYPIKKGPDGAVDIQLTPAPLFLRSGDAGALAKALQNAEVLGAGANMKVAFQPTLEGEILANVKNLTGREQSGNLILGKESLPFTVAGQESTTIPLAGSTAPAFGKMFRWNSDFKIEQPGQESVPQKWAMEYFYVPKVNGIPDWDSIPAIEMTNRFRPVVDMKQTPGGHAEDISASFKAAWDKENFYLRVEAEDDIFNVNEPAFWTSEHAKKTALYSLDGCLEVYFDCAANGRLGNQGYDLDDYRYDFSVNNPEGQSGPALVYRMQEVFNEYAGGVEFPTKEKAAQGIKSEFTRISDTRYAYTITFAQKYIAPLRLEKGTLAGFSLYLHDRMDDGTMGNKGLSLTTELGAHADRSPHLWPLMILGE